MKLLIVIPTYAPAWAAGGTVTATANLCQALVKQRVDITVYTTDADGKGGRLEVPASKAVDVGGVKVWYFRCNLGKYGFYSADFSRKIKETAGDFDLVSVGAIWQWLQVDVLRTCMAHGVPYIVSPHGSLNTWSWRQKTFKKKIYWALFGRKTLLNAAAIHFTAEDEREQTFSCLPELMQIPSFIIPNGIEVKPWEFTGNIRARLNIPDDKFVMLYTGRLHHKKGIHFVIEAMKQVGDKRLLLLLVGTKEDLPYCRILEEISADIFEQVKWIGQVPANAVWDYYSASNLFILPSHDENFGMVVAEAMACGLPVMVSRNVGIWREVEKDNAGFVVNQNVDEIEVLLKKIICEPLSLKVISDNAKTSACMRYNIESTARLMKTACADVLSGAKTEGLQWK